MPRCPGRREVVVEVEITHTDHRQVLSRRPQPQALRLLRSHIRIATCKMNQDHEELRAGLPVAEVTN